MTNIISYSLYGHGAQYLIGAIRNAEAVPVFYPGWRARFYVGNSVDSSVRRQLADLGAEVIPIPDREDASAMFWRFLAFFDPDVQRVLVRDADSRLSAREAAAVDAWLQSDKDFHIMRDHPAHNCPILGGLWGAVTKPLRTFSKAFEAANPEGRYGEDQEFLAREVYPLARTSALIHDSFFFREAGSQRFPTERDGLAFVGEVFDENDKPRQADRQILSRAETRVGYRYRLKLSSFIHDFVGL